MEALQTRITDELSWSTAMPDHQETVDLSGLLA